MAKIKKNNQDNTPLTLAEFKAWLNGVSDMQETTWSPNKEQWEKIKSQIDRIQELNTDNRLQSNTLNQSVSNSNIPDIVQSNIHQSIPTNSAFEQLKVKSSYPSMPNKDTAGINIDVNNPPLPGTEFV